MRRSRAIRAAAAAALGLLAAGGAAAAPELWQTNAHGDDIHVFDVASRRLVHRLVVGPEPHGIAAPADARVVYVSVEANDRPRGELLWIDPRRYAVRHRLVICREPHEIATTPDGRWVYVPCRDGSYRVVDARARRVVARIETGGRPHNVRISPDGRFAYLSPMGAPAAATVADVAAGHRVVGEIPFAGSVRPSALSEDGRLLFQHVDGLNGFQVADVRRRRVVATVEHATSLGWFLLHPRAGWVGPRGLQRCHGLEVRPGAGELWSACGAGLTVHDITAPPYPERSHVALESKAYWLTFSPDGRWAFVALSGAGRVAVVDARARQVVEHLEAGRGPKRNLVIDPGSDSPAD